MSRTPHGEEVVLSSASQTLSEAELSLLDYAEAVEDGLDSVWAGQHQNILALSLLLCLALVTNLSAAPVILFRRTR